MSLTLALVLLAQTLQQTTQAPVAGQPERLPPVLRQRIAPVRATTPASGDTVGYWQQRLRYTVTATLDEAPGVLHAAGTLVYVNHSPDTLREFYVHQHLNAFRPGSKWSATDEREGRVRFQRLADPDYAYERFTSVPTFDGVPAAPAYPGAPDSTVARFVLPRALAPNDSVTVAFRWDARPSTTPRRQARRGRSFDFAQWFPKPAVYDRGGWEPHAFVPAGELYGEFGDYDVTLVVRRDQVIGSTGVPVDGDPGWGAVTRSGAVRETRGDYAHVPPAPAVVVPDGYKAVRFYARDVHHFGWSASPDYIYEGGTYVRRTPTPAGRVVPWDTVAVHVLYRPGDEKTWGGGLAVERTRRALAWLESRYGAYAYPQMTVLHRIEGGGTEFPMMQMNGSASQGLILHEGGHVFSYGILANNEWRSGWMDEGLTEYQSEWAQGLTRPERFTGVQPLSQVLGVPPIAAGERVVGFRVQSPATTQQYALDLEGLAEPIGTQSERFRDFGIYNAMIYTRAALMYGALRDVLGDSTFTRFLHDYYAKWALRHVDEPAMRASAEAVSGRDLGWFFDQWVHHTGLIDYAVTRASTTRAADGWLTRVRVHRRGEYRHPMPVGVRTSAGWTVVRADALLDDQTVEVRTAEKPTEASLDPYRTTEDWYRPNDASALHWWRPAPAPQIFALDRVFVDPPASDERVVNAYLPMIWTSQPNGALIGARLRSSYQGIAGRSELGIVLATRPARDERAGPWDVAPNGRVQWWVSGENPWLPWRSRPTMGLSYGVWTLDGISKVQLRKAWDRSAFATAAGRRAQLSLAFTGTYPYSRTLPDPLRWSGVSVSEGTFGFTTRTTSGTGVGADATLSIGRTSGDRSFDVVEPGHTYERAELSLSGLRGEANGRLVSFVRGYLGYQHAAPIERQIFLSVSDPTSTFGNHFWRPRGGLLAPPTLDPDLGRVGHTPADGHYLPLGGAALRGYDPRFAIGSIAAVNAEQAVVVHAFRPGASGLKLYASLFGDAGLGLEELLTTRALADAGAGLSLRGRLFDRDIRVRADFPVYVRFPTAAVGSSFDGRVPSDVRYRFAFSFNDLW